MPSSRAVSLRFPRWRARDSRITASSDESPNGDETSFSRTPVTIRSGKCSASMTSPRQRTKACSVAFSNSRTLPGQTQCIYNMEEFKAWIHQVVDQGLDRKVHILAGVTPLKSLGMARYMAKNVSGIEVPGSLIKRIKGVPKEKRTQEGIEICIGQIQQLRETPGVHGIHLMAIEWEQRVPEIVEGAGLYPRPS